jgi:hypothetical protein
MLFIYDHYLPVVPTVIKSYLYSILPLGIISKTRQET